MGKSTLAMHYREMLVYSRFLCGGSSAVEHLLPKQRVAGSIPVPRSKEQFRAKIEVNIWWQFRSEERGRPSRTQMYGEAAAAMRDENDPNSDFDNVPM